MARTRAWDVTVGLQQSAMPYADRLVTLKLGDQPTIHMELDEAIKVARRLNTFVNMVTTPKRRKAVL